VGAWAVATRITGSALTLVLAEGFTMSQQPQSHPDERLTSQKPAKTAADLESASRGNATVTGELIRTGGMLGAPTEGIAGTIRFTGSDGTVTSATAQSDGSFSISLPPGQYLVCGIPGWLSRDLDLPAKNTVVVPPGGLDGLSVIVPIR
jgi:hypothetical protein